MSAREALLTAQQVAELLGLAPGTILDRFERGDLPGFRLFAGTDKRGRPTGTVRFRASEILAWIEQQRPEPSPGPVAKPAEAVA